MKDKQTVSFALIHSPLDEIASETTPSDLVTETVTRAGSVTPAQRKISTTYRIDASAKEQLQTPRPEGPYAMSVQWVGGPYDVASFFCIATYGVQISVEISATAMLTVTSLADTGASPNLVNKDFFRLHGESR